MTEPTASASLMSTHSYAILANVLLHHLRHCGTFLGTCSARFGTGSQFLVIWKFLAGSSAFLTALGTANGHGSRERTLSGAQGRTTLATVSTIQACIHALEIVFLSFVNHRGTMRKARIALKLAIIACGCAFEHMCRMRTILDRTYYGRKTAYKAQSNCNRGDRSCSEIQKHRIHRLVFFW